MRKHAKHIRPWNLRLWLSGSVLVRSRKPFDISVINDYTSKRCAIWGGFLPQLRNRNVPWATVLFNHTYDGLTARWLDKLAEEFWFVFCCEMRCDARWVQNKTGRAQKAIDQLYLVAGAGFEPTTFGLWARRAARLLHPASEEWSIA